MAKPKKLKLAVEKLMVGFMVDIELSWSKHPFLFSKFKISSPQEIAIIKKLGLTQVTVFPEQSDSQMAKASAAANSGPPDDTAIEQFESEQWSSKNSKIDGAEQYRSKRRVVDKKYQEQSRMVQQMTKDLKSSPANAIRDAGDLVDSMSQDFVGQTDLLTNLVNLGSGVHTVYNHTVNVMVLSMSLAHAVGIEGNEFRILARGALLHDVGKIDLPGTITNKTGALSKSEMGVFRQHAQFGRRLCESVEGSREELLQVIEGHHEYLDGTGYPNQLKGDQITQLMRIVAIANTYDNLCNPPDIKRALTPKIALATMYSKFKEKLDNDLVQTFISFMGVYPPGSIVSLNDESIGVVVCVDPKAMLTPEVLVYNPDIPPQKAIILNLAEHEDIKIVRVLKPSDCPRRVYAYLGVKERVGYMSSAR